jgi:hypothetical protein
VINKLPTGFDELVKYICNIGVCSSVNMLLSTVVIIQYDLLVKSFISEGGGLKGVEGPANAISPRPGHIPVVFVTFIADCNSGIKSTTTGHSPPLAVGSKMEINITNAIENLIIMMSANTQPCACPGQLLQDTVYKKNCQSTENITL